MRRGAAAAVLLPLALLLPCRPSGAVEPAARWVGSHPTPGVNRFVAAASDGATTVVVVGMWGVILTSNDGGVSWRFVSSGTNADLVDVLYTGSRWVIAGAESALLTSNDGSNWRRVQGIAPTDGTWGLAMGDGRIVAIGHVPLYSDDHGLSWSPIPSPPDFPDAVSWGNGRFVATDMAGVVWTSDTGLSWTESTPLPDAYYDALGFGGGLFVTASDDRRIFTSLNGELWTERTSPLTGYPFDVAWGNGLFMIVGDSGAVVTSPNGETWTAHDLDPASDCNGVSWNGSGFVVVGAVYDSYHGTRGQVRLTSDGTAWTPISSGGELTVARIRQGGGRLVGVGYMILSSEDGFGWEEHASPVGRYLSGLAYGNGTWVATAAQGTIVTSPDGATWTQQAGIGSQNVTSVAFGNGSFVAVTESHQAFTSTDGVGWAPRTVPGSGNLYGVHHADGQFVAVGAGLWTSPDGISWTQRAYPSSNWLMAVTRGEGLWVAVGENGAVVSSPDGVDWMTHSTPMSDFLLDVAFGEGTWVVTGGGVHFSSDLESWYEAVTQNFRPMKTVVFAHSMFVAGGEYGRIQHTVCTEILFRDGFEAGGTTAWSAIVGR